VNPIDIVANAIHAADPNLNLSTPRLAKVAVAALIHEDILDNAAHALSEDPAADGKDWNQCRKIAHAVLASLGGA
jgi:hypothetical protein